MTTLKDKSLHELRQIAQGLGVPDVFQKDSLSLKQAIEEQQKELYTPPAVEPPPIPQYDARLMSKPPARTSDKDSIKDLLSHHVGLGLHLDFIDEETWIMRFGQKEDTGTVRMPLRAVFLAADRIMK